jgi:CHAT domain-containing protein
MRRFYEGLHDGLSPREALAAAQRHVRGLTRESAGPELAALREAAVAAGRPDPGAPAGVPEDFSHPYHWAGFVLIGL